MRRFTAVAALLVLVIVCSAAEYRVVFDKKSEFSRVQVRDYPDGTRALVFDDAATQSAMSLKNPDELLLEYTKASMTALAFVSEPTRVLIVGLGGGSMPNYLRKNFPRMVIDVAEIDPVVVEAAKGFFNFKEDASTKVFVGDGRKFIETTSNRYDIIFLDAYGADWIPYLLATEEFLKSVRAHLNDGGIVASNVWGPHSNKLWYSMVKTYKAVFDEVYIVRAPAASENRIIVALPKKQQLTPERLVQRAKKIEPKLKPRLELGEMILVGYMSSDPLPPSAKVLLDKDEPK